MSLTYSDASFKGTPTVKIIEYSYTDDGKDGWNYLLTAYDENGDKAIDDNEKISYDEIGNPLTYRGYCYDYDIELYYLQSRYYDPEICRFINADSTDYLGTTGTLLSYNLFAYCENDPVDYVDLSGCYKDYAFTIIPGMTYGDIIYAISKDVESTKKTYVKASIKYMDFSTRKKYIYNSNILALFSNTGIYIEYMNPSYIIQGTSYLYSTYYNKKTYAEWLLFVIERHWTVWEKMKFYAMEKLDLTEDQIDDINEILELLFDLVAPEKVKVAHKWIKRIIDVVDILMIVFDKVDDYVMAILNRRPKLKKSENQIAIMWSITKYTNEQFYKGVMQKGWKVVKTYYAWEL